MQLYWQFTPVQPTDSSHILIPHHLHPGGNRKPGFSDSVLQSRHCTCVLGQESCPMQQRRLSQLSGTRYLMYFYHHQTSLMFCCVWYQTFGANQSFAHQTVSRLRTEPGATFFSFVKVCTWTSTFGTRQLISGAACQSRIPLVVSDTRQHLIIDTHETEIRSSYVWNQTTIC